MKLTCTCQHASQDKLHGKQIRIFNQGIKSAKCTVCGSTVSRDSGPSVSKKSSKK